MGEGEGDLVAGDGCDFARFVGRDAGYETGQRGDQRGGVLGPLTPVILWDPQHGCAKFEIVGDLHLMKPEQYRMSLSELELEYPAPQVQLDHQTPEGD